MVSHGCALHFNISIPARVGLDAADDRCQHCDDNIKDRLFKVVPEVRSEWILKGFEIEYGIEIIIDRKSKIRVKIRTGIWNMRSELTAGQDQEQDQNCDQFKSRPGSQSIKIHIGIENSMAIRNVSRAFKIPSAIRFDSYHGRKSRVSKLRQIKPFVPPRARRAIGPSLKHFITERVDQDLQDTLGAYASP
ncbi:hypothetical protein EVAR_5576_1 [Eumeta japonica]|uniref:Uncharacterized protein n=1 Tax=Eumeta variegata TaxID=151549 RepID=A0A4C1U2T9_EUMVA|nr:hypothetical protein EVAR_5576_1 [Eumeta japonica]